MSEFDLNPKGAPPSTPERFNFKRHMHEGKPLLSSARMLVRTVFTVASVGALLAGGVYLLAGGTVPSLQQFNRSERSRVGGGFTANSKSTEQEFQELLDRYSSKAPSDFRTSNGEWTMPPDVFDPSLAPAGAGGDPSIDLPQGDSTARVPKMKLDGFVVVAPDYAIADASVQLDRYISGQQWFEEKGLPSTVANAALAIHRPVRYAFEFHRLESGWRIAKQTPLAKNGAFIRTADDAEAKPPELQGMSGFSDQRPTFEAFESTMQSLASRNANGEFPLDFIASDYALVQSNGETLTREKAQGTLSSFYNQVSNVSIAAKLLGVAQKDPNTVVCMVNYRAEFSPTPSANRYSAPWTDKVIWTRAGTGWNISKTQRMSFSPLLTKYGYGY